MAYPSYYNPYVNQFLQPQQNNNNCVSKVVDSLEMVRGADIPMDGQAYYFPKADGSMVYSKKWLPNCTTQIMAYSPQINEQLNTLSNNNAESVKSANMLDADLSDRMKRIEEKIVSIESMLLERKNDESTTVFKPDHKLQGNEQSNDKQRIPTYAEE